ncbi:hypothetical protein GGR56DRAFT_674765 [Xylariaceae sp. FL0804]|nr:hypothetical protein GGR56DRAFT_674765 [Xylariaceae sp. FL0804]
MTSPPPAPATTIASPSPPRAPPARTALLLGLVFDAAIPASARALFGAPAAIEAAVRADLASARASPLLNVHVTTLMLDPAPGRAEEGLARLEALLRRGTPGVVVGAGVRLIPELTPLFEAVVDACRRVAPDVPVVFPRAPGAVTEALQRALARAG